MIKALSENFIKTDTELRQAALRVMISSVCALLYGNIIIHQTIFLLALLHLSISLGNLYYAMQKTHHASFRKYGMLLIDTIFLSAALYLGDLNSLILYPVFLWLILGNGLRYGKHFLLIATLVTTIGFTLSSTFNPSWAHYHTLSIILSVSLVIIPVSYMALIHQIHTLNRHLGSEIQNTTDKLQSLENTDILTRVQNRSALEQSICNGEKNSLILIDIANFQHFNNLYGIEIGNTILQAFARHLQTLTEEMSYTLYRAYGDGFVMLCTKSDCSIETFKKDAEHILHCTESIKFDVEIENTLLPIDINITLGLAFDESDKTLEKASIALHHAKKIHQHYFIYSEALNNTEKLQALSSAA